MQSHCTLQTTQSTRDCSTFLIFFPFSNSFGQSTPPNTFMQPVSVVNKKVWYPNQGHEVVEQGVRPIWRRCVWTPAVSGTAGQSYFAENCGNIWTRLGNHHRGFANLRKLRYLDARLHHEISVTKTDTHHEICIYVFNNDTVLLDFCSKCTRKGR